MVLATAATVIRARAFAVTAAVQLVECATRAHRARFHLLALVTEDHPPAIAHGNAVVAMRAVRDRCARGRCRTDLWSRDDVHRGPARAIRVGREQHLLGRDRRDDVEAARIRVAEAIAEHAQQALARCVRQHLEAFAQRRGAHEKIFVRELLDARDQPVEEHRRGFEQRARDRDRAAQPPGEQLAPIDTDSASAG